MSDAANRNQDDHWNRLAFELGLEPEPPKPTPAAVEDRNDLLKDVSDDLFASSQQEVVEPIEARPPAAPPRGRRRRNAPEPVAAPEVKLPAEPDLLDDEPPAGSRTSRDRKEVEASEEADDGPLDDLPGFDDVNGPVLDTDAPVEAASDSEAPAGDEPKKGRRRRRPRRKKPGEQPAAADGDIEPSDESPEESSSDTAPVDDDDAAPEVIADWNVPSWNELIASLYRPER